MDGSIKIEFLDEDDFNIYYISDNLFKTEEEFKAFFKLLDNELLLRYDYNFNGFYEVTIYYSSGIYVLEFRFIDDYGVRDFDITLLLNTTLLYEFYDEELIKGEKIYYKDKYYCEVEKIAKDIRIFEYGRIIYGKEVNNILKKGLLIK